MFKSIPNEVIMSQEWLGCWHSVRVNPSWEG